MSRQLEGKAVTRVKATPAVGADEPDVELAYTTVKQVGKGAFGVVVLAELVDSAETVAIKKMQQDKRTKDREPQVRCLCVAVIEAGSWKDEFYLNLIMDHVPTLGICHRDVKPPNMLVDHDSALLNLCYFGSAKRLVPGELNKCLIGTRYYRALELLLCAEDYTTKIDVWSAGCLLAELLLGHPIFPGEPPWQLIKICQVRGTPTKAQMQEVQPNYIAALRQAPVRSWAEIFGNVPAPPARADEASTSDEESAFNRRRRPPADARRRRRPRRPRRKSRAR